MAAKCSAYDNSQSLLWLKFDCYLFTPADAVALRRGVYQICPVFYNNLLKKYSNYSPDTQKNIAIIVKMQHECEEQVRGRFLNKLCKNPPS